MNTLRYFIGSFVVFLFIFMAEWLFHGMIMNSTYIESQHLLRPEAEAVAYFPSMIAGFLVLSFGFCYIFTKGYEDKGLGEGARYGFLIGLAFSIPTSLMNFAVFPIPSNWIISWCIGEPIIMTLAGIIFASIYRPRKV
ncbi:MAG: hypothetical protein OEV49_06235 [candidate division Zixibacteria bacterium]|nr:hypothetical protein [candidate division Zixibacteria bacterium]MDH3936606.1 hypothetical protein [candidate division Zixibacteria bacterium]MDH4034092.1 hypothetical protein [candidate division Zixibacteria bacterium]